MIGSKEHFDLFLDGLKVSNVIYFPKRKNLHNHEIKNGCIVVNVTMVFSDDIELTHASMGDDTLLEA